MYVYLFNLYIHIMVYFTIHLMAMLLSPVSPDQLHDNALTSLPTAIKALENLQKLNIR